MNRLFRIILISMVIVSLWGVARIQDQVTKLESKTKQEFGFVTEWSYQIDRHLLEHKGRIDSLAQVLDLSVLESCGIITNGYNYGSCVAIGPDLILTAGHCTGISNAWIEIGGVKYEITEEWASDKYDIGFARIEGNVPFVVFGEMPTLLNDVYSVGAPYDINFENCITKGIISKFDVNWEEWKGLIQTDAEGAHGSSGSPLFNKQSELLGICVAGPVDGGGVTLCEPVSHIKEALSEYME